MIFAGDAQDARETEEFALGLARGFQRIMDVYGGVGVQIDQSGRSANSNQPEHQQQLQTYEALERVVNPNAGARTDDVQLLCRKMNSRVLRRYAQMCYWNGEDCAYLDELEAAGALRRALVNEEDAREVSGILAVERVLRE